MSKSTDGTAEDVTCSVCGTATALVCPECDVTPLCAKCAETYGQCSDCDEDEDDALLDDDDGDDFDDDDDEAGDTFTDHDDEMEDDTDEGSTGASDK